MGVLRPWVFSRFWCAWVPLTALLVLAGLPEGRTQSRSSAKPVTELTREQVIANFLMNCLHFGDWSRAAPTNPPSPTIGIIGEDRRDALRKALDAIIARAPPGQVRYQAVRGDSFEELQDCRVVVVTSPRPAEVAELARKLAGRPVLLVAEYDGFLELGGTVEFKAPVGGKLQFQVNLDQLERSKVRLSSNFLKYAGGFLHQGTRRAEFPAGGKP